MTIEATEYYTSATTHVHEQTYYDLATSNMIVFQIDRNFIQTTAVPRYKLLSLFESFGGLAVLVWWVARWFVATVESRLLESELISGLYQVEKPLDKSNENNKSMSFGESIGKLVSKVTHTQRITDDELQTVNKIIDNRENFKAGWKEWLNNIF